MKKLVLAINMIILFLASVQAVDNVRTPEMRSMGMGIKGVTESASFNPAITSFMTQKEISANYYNRFMMKEMGTTFISFIYPTQRISTGLFLSTSGNNFYRDSQFFFSLGKRINKYWYVGMDIAYRFLQIEILKGTPAFISTDFGVVYQPFEKIKLGISLLNFPYLSIGNIPFQGFTEYSLHAGCSWKIISSVMLVAEVENNYETSFQGNIGMEYSPFTSLYIRTGINSTPLQPYMGVGYTFQAITADMALGYHSVLGISSGISLKVRF